MEGAVQRRECPKRFARNRLARCAVRHAVPARYRNRPLPLRFQRQPYRHRPARRQTDQLSTPTRIPTNRSRKSAIGQPKTAKAANKPATSTATTSASQKR